MLSSVYLNVVLFVCAVIIISGLLMVMDDLVASSFYLRETQKPLREHHGTEMDLAGFNYTNYSTPDRVELYWRDVGNTVLETNCLDLFIDTLRIERENLTLTLLDTSFDPDFWNPDEVIEVETLTDLSVGEHAARLVACNGAFNEGLFNASRCGDGICTGGEYCNRDNSSCTDDVCYEPLCLNGCTEVGITDDIDIGECDSSGTGCVTDSCICDSSSNCCGADGSTGCISNSDCCSGACSTGVC
jgi:hypothetical protein